MAGLGQNCEALFPSDLYSESYHSEASWELSLTSSFRIEEAKDSVNSDSGLHMDTGLELVSSFQKRMQVLSTARVRHSLPTKPGLVQQHLLSHLRGEVTGGCLMNRQTSDDMMYDYITLLRMTHMVIKGFCRRVSTQMLAVHLLVAGLSRKILDIGELLGHTHGYFYYSCAERESKRDSLGVYLWWRKGRKRR